MADPIWQSACKECFPKCGYEGPRFKNCEKRIQRLKEIGGLAEPPPMKSVKGKGESMPQKKPKALNAVTLDKITKAAKAICKASGIDYKRELMTKLKDKKVTQVRQHVIVVISGEPFGLSNGQVASFLRLSQQYVSHVLNHHKYIMSSQHGEPGMSVDEQESHKIMIDFNGQEDLLAIVKHLAVKELRPLNLQLLHMVKSQAKLLYEEYEMEGTGEGDFIRTFDS